MKMAYLRAIDTAQHTINIADPYFSDEDVINHLADAAKRGVQVSLVLPHRNNHPFEQDAERAAYPELLKAGVHIYEYTGRPMAHDKVGTFDGQLSTIGSSNLDARSLWNNDEANVWTRDPAVAKDLDTNLFSLDEKQSVPVTSYDPGPIGQVVNGAAQDIEEAM